jgi:hypothetical protein
MFWHSDSATFSLAEKARIRGELINHLSPSRDRR